MFNNAKNTTYPVYFFIGQTVTMDFGTSPTRKGTCLVTGAIEEIYPNGDVRLSKSEPYFGYNRCHISNIV